MGLENYLSRTNLLLRRSMGKFLSGIKPMELRESMAHLLMAGGKRLRPCLLLLSCEAVGGRMEDAREAAVAIEFLHTFTLIHDDIMDGSARRRGVPTVHTIWGRDLAITAGDALCAKAFEALDCNASRVGLSDERFSNLLHTFARATFDVCMGQALDLVLGKKPMRKKDYFELVRLKTGSLFRASAKAGAILGGGKMEEVEALGEYALWLGVAFQIRDDVLDLVGGKEFGKEKWRDLKEGKMTLPILLAIELGARELTSMLRGGIRGNQIEEAVRMVESTGAIEAARRIALQFSRRAVSYLGRIRDSEAKQALKEMATFVVERRE
ncbi:MAG: polyprenyl synthetase family protein [Candidatus Hadarchaeales archaeon]